MVEHNEDLKEKFTDEEDVDIVALSSENINSNEGQIEITEEKKGIIQKLKDKKGVFGIIGGILAILFKFKAIIFLILSKLKFLLVILKLGKSASTLISMTLMIVVYAKMYGLAFGVGFVLLLFAHEMGHYITARKLNMNVSLPLFIPFVGALISLKEEPQNAITEAKMAIGGPIVGSLAALFCLVIYEITKYNYLLALAYTGFFLNIFNLIPLHPLDGGRTVSAISKKMWIVGIILGAVVTVKFFNPIMILLLIMGVVQLINQWKSEDKDYYNVSFNTRLSFALLYFGLLILLGIGMWYTHGINLNVIS